MKKAFSGPEIPAQGTWMGIFWGLNTCNKTRELSVWPVKPIYVYFGPIIAIFIGFLCENLPFWPEIGLKVGLRPSMSDEMNWNLLW